MADKKIGELTSKELMEELKSAGVFEDAIKKTTLKILNDIGLDVEKDTKNLREDLMFLRKAREFIWKIIATAFTIFFWACGAGVVYYLIEKNK